MGLRKAVVPAWSAVVTKRWPSCQPVRPHKDHRLVLERLDNAEDRPGWDPARHAQNQQVKIRFRKFRPGAGGFVSLGVIGDGSRYRQLQACLLQHFCRSGTAVNNELFGGIDFAESDEARSGLSHLGHELFLPGCQIYEIFRSDSF